MKWQRAVGISTVVLLASVVLAVTQHLSQPAHSNAVPHHAKTAAAKVMLSNPKSHQRIDCARNPEGIYRCAVNGTSEGVTGNLQLLLWVYPVQPSGDGWYLQKGKINGIHSLQRSGNWSGIAQVGNLEWPPHEGDTIELAVTVLETSEAQKLLKSDGLIVLGSPVGETLDHAMASDVRVHFR